MLTRFFPSNACYTDFLLVSYSDSAKVIFDLAAKTKYIWDLVLESKYMHLLIEKSSGLAVEIVSGLCLHRDEGLKNSRQNFLEKRANYDYLVRFK